MIVRIVVANMGGPEVIQLRPTFHMLSAHHYRYSFVSVKALYAMS